MTCLSELEHRSNQAQHPGTLPVRDAPMATLLAAVLFVLVMNGSAEAEPVVDVTVTPDTATSR